MSPDSILIIINNLFLVLGGVVVFMIGMEMMGSNLEKAAGKNIRKLMGRATKNRFTGIGTGAVVTALVNSSAATTVMIVGFVNVGFMTLVQAASVIMGANIGTTISAFIMALSSVGGAQFSVASLFALIAFVGFVFTIVAKDDKFKRVGCILEGIGLIFIGLNVMSGAVNTMLAKDEIESAVRGVFQIFKPPLTWEIIVLFLLGAVLTAMLQSSAALTAIVISLAGQQLITLQAAMCIILGANVGTCFTSVLSAMGASVNAKRAAAVHLLFNVAGCVLFIFPVAFAGNYIAQFLNSFISTTEWQIAIFHMCFNLVTTIILIPFLNYLVKLACIIVPDKAKEASVKDDTQILDKRLLKTPAIAVGQARSELVRMGQLAFKNYKRSLEMLLTFDLSQKEEFDKTEQAINALNKYVTQFLVKLSSQEISETDERKVSSFYHVASDIERIGDYAENIVEYAQTMLDAGAKFSDDALEEIKEMDSRVSNLYQCVEWAFANHDLSRAADIEKAEKETDQLCLQMKNNHIRRSNDGTCSTEASAVYLQLAINMERIGDHMHNISNSLKSYVGRS